MRKDEFREWMQGRIKERPISDCLSRCGRVEKALNIDLDDEFSKDHCKEVLSRLSYSVADEKANKPALPSFEFKPGVSLRFRFTDLRSAVKRYINFCESIESSKQ